MRRLVDTIYGSLAIDEGERLVYFTRTAEVFPDHEAAREFVDAVLMAVSPYGGQNYAVLSDVRAAVGVRDKELEAILKELRVEFVTGFRAVALVVRTAAGQLQSDRFRREMNDEVCVFRDEQD
ncbi:MAG: hypothetical protein AAFQ82_01995, partial [Myxococcota bacterium]